MALIKETVKAGILEAFTQVMHQEDDQREAALNKIADTIADTVIAAIKSAQITYNGGLTAPSGGGPVTGTFGYKID